MAGRLLLIFIAFPLLETWLLIEVGSVIGGLWTIALIIVTAIVGSQLVRHQGLGVMRRVREYQSRGEAPALPMLEGMALLIAGFCLIMPGIISSTLGFLLLIPPLRTWVAKRLMARMITVQPGVYDSYGYTYPGGSQGRHSDPTVIDGDYHRDDD